MRLSINPQPVTKPHLTLPEPPFVLDLHQDPQVDWHSFLDAYPEVMEQYRWISGHELRCKGYDTRYRFFYEDMDVAQGEHNNQSWTVIRWPL